MRYSFSRPRFLCWITKLSFKQGVIGTGVGLVLGVVGYFAIFSESTLHQTFEGGLKGWAGGLALCVVIVAYGAGLRALRVRARTDRKTASHTRFEAFEDESGLSANELERYQRHILVKEIGGAGQVALKSARVLIIGAGGLGSPVLLYLGAAGVGTLGIIDDDKVSLSNLQRQIIHTEVSLTGSKTASVARALAELNSHVRTKLYEKRFDSDGDRELFAQYDLIIDCSDNFETRALIARTAFEAGKPVIAGAMAQWEGEVGFYHPHEGTPCYRCATPVAPKPADEKSCAQVGVVAALPGVIGTVMAMEAIKYLTGAGTMLGGRLMLYDALSARSWILTFERRTDCVLCGSAEVKNVAL